jgi:hypothetical protein
MDRVSNSIALLHNDVVGQRYGCFSVIKGLDADLLSRKFDFSFIGHYHESRKIRENVFSVGSSNMLNFSEIRQRKGWWLFDSEADPVVRFIENTESPVFRDITLENGDDGSTIAEKFGAESLQWDYFRIKIKGLEIPENINMIKWKRVTLENTSDTKSRADVKFSDSVDTVLKKYISARNVNNLDIETLHEVGRSFL